MIVLNLTVGLGLITFYLIGLG